MTKYPPFEVRRLFPLAEDLVSEMRKSLQILRSSQRLLISSTLTSDGDSIGAQLGVLFLMEALGKDPREIVIVNESPVPVRYQFLEGTSHILSWEDWQKQKKSLNSEFDCGLVCDGGIERTGKVAELFDKIPQKILVDHHAVGSDLSYAATVLDTSASSTCELIFHLLEEEGLELSQKLAAALYVGIVFDTGFFKHSLTTPRTHLVASRLISTGIDFSEICDRALLERSLKGQTLLKKLMQNMRSRLDGRILSSHWSKQDLEEAQAEDGDSEGMINQLYYTRESDVVALFVETAPGQIKVSFRSKGLVNVAEFARSLNPNGGGHVRASGCSMSGSLSVVQDQVLSALEKTLLNL